MEKETVMLKEQYKLAIDARDKLNDNYHKWMTFYYVANAAILVAITQLFKEGKLNLGIQILSILGIIICIFWNLSCKGYYYWSKSWIEIIQKLEKKYIEDNTELGVYSAFSENVESSTSPFKQGNISTPKLTLLFSAIAISGWILFSIYVFSVLFYCLPNFYKFIFSFIFIGIMAMFYFFIQRFVKSIEE